MTNGLWKKLHSAAELLWINNNSQYFPHRLKYRFVVVDIINSDNDTSSGNERVWPSWRVVICGCYIQDILQALKLGQGRGAETNQPYKDHRPIKLQVIKDGPTEHSFNFPLVIKQDVIATVALDGEWCAIIKHSRQTMHTGYCCSRIVERDSEWKSPPNYTERKKMDMQTKSQKQFHSDDFVTFLI